MQEYTPHRNSAAHLTFPQLILKQQEYAMLGYFFDYVYVYADMCVLLAEH